MTLVTFPAPPGQQQWLRRESLADKIGWVDASVEVVRAFECGINFGRKVAPRRQYPLWTGDEWREALQNAVGEPDVAFYADTNLHLVGEICGSPLRSNGGRKLGLRDSVAALLPGSHARERVTGLTRRNRLTHNACRCAMVGQTVSSVACEARSFLRI